MRGWAVLFAGCIVLGGCGDWVRESSVVKTFTPPGTGPGLIGLEMFTVINTQKTVLDHVASFATGKDCSTLRSQDGGEYCKEVVRLLPREQKTVYCYRSLGGVNCFDRPLVEVRDTPVGNGNEPTPISLTPY
ncbi:MAG: hypothetical protein H7840_14320 [Alphaproteobacteria bacterium]